jgi:DNA-binding HxlR family transcriptional regulator
VDKNQIDASRDRKIDEIVDKQLALDDLCHEIFLTLQAYKKLRFNELLRSLKKLGVKITKPTLTEHLKHLIELNLVERREEDFQYVSYGLTKEAGEIFKDIPVEELRKWIEATTNDEHLPTILRPLKMTRKEFYASLSAEQLDKMAITDLSDILAMNLFELKTFIEYDLNVDRYKSTSDFWDFVGNPLYRLQEKSVAENCRASDEYKKLLFDKIALLIEELRSDKERLRQRQHKLAKK